MRAYFTEKNRKHHEKLSQWLTKSFDFIFASETSNRGL